MIINSTGIVKSDITDYLEFWTVKLREIYGNSFIVKKEGLVDNIATAGSLSCMALEDVILYLSKQMNPYTAEGEFQDALYALIGLERQYATFTKVTRTIEGEANTVCDVGSVRFKNSATDDIFELNTAVTVGENGTVEGSFTAIQLGAVELDSSALLEIIDAPDGISGVYYSEGNTTNVGLDYEGGSDFRLRWSATNSVKSGNTEGGMYSALLPLCGNNKKNVSIRQNRNTEIYSDFDLHTMNITVKSAESNDVIANTIFENLMDGVGLYGNIDVTVQDLSGEDVTIYFDRATGVRTYFKVEVYLKNGYTLAQVSSKVKQAITDNFDYHMGEKVVANDFYEYINKLEEIDYAIIKVSLNGISWLDLLTLEYNEYGTIQTSDITVIEGA